MPRTTVCVLGSGASGLVTAKTLLDDDFDVEIISRDQSAGGVWSAARVYPELYINNVNGEYEFAAMSMRLSSRNIGRPSGTDMCKYMEEYAKIFLNDRIRYNTRVLNIRRRSLASGGQEPGNWILTVKNINSSEDSQQKLYYDALVLCTGGCDHPNIPPNLSPEAAQRAGFLGPVLHTFHLPSRWDEVLPIIKPQTDSEPGRIIVVGGGKSAQDTCAFLAKHASNHNVAMVFEKADAFVAAPFPLPAFIRKSRLLSVFSPYIHLRSRLERFLHATWLGSKIVDFFWDALAALSASALSIPKHSPLQNRFSLKWSIRVNDEGFPRQGSFFSLVNSGAIELIAPARVVSFGSDGHTVVLNDGRTIRADGVILATGYSSSWRPLFDDVTWEEIGLGRRSFDFSRHGDTVENIRSEWQHYKTLGNPPPASKANIGEEEMMSCLIRGVVPAKNILRHDFAVNGGVFTTSPAYIYELSAHWISSYLLRDPFLRMPSSIEEAMSEAEKVARWTKARYPGMLRYANDSYASTLCFWNGPQFGDELLGDMGLQSMRSGDGWLWPFAVSSTEQHKNIGLERAALRTQE